MSALLAFREVSCVRGGRLLFEDLSFTLAPGGGVLVCGFFGVGLSSLIRVAPARGAVEGMETRALMAEALALDAARPLAEALLFWAKLDEAPDPKDRVARALDATALAPLAEVPVRLLSTGQRRRAALARVVASDAPVWLLDEPANGLDIASVATLTALIAAHRAGGGVALVATHLPLDLPDAQVIALEAMA